MVYAKTLNPEFFDYRVYECDFNEDMVVDGNREYADINGEDLKEIKKMINAFEGWDYEYYYHNSIKDLLTDYLPKKRNGKKLSPKEIGLIKQSLLKEYRYHSDYEENIIIVCLSIIHSKPYDSFDLKGCCQGEWVKLYAPKDTDKSYVDYLEAIYFNTGTEIMVDEESENITDPDDIFGYSFYTTSYNNEDLKAEIAKQCGCDISEVVLWKFDGYYKMEKYAKC